MLYIFTLNACVMQPFVTSSDPLLSQLTEGESEAVI